MHDVGIFAKTTKSDVSYGVQTPSTKENRKKINNMHQIVLNMPKENIQKNSDFFSLSFHVFVYVVCVSMCFAPVKTHTCACGGPKLNQEYSSTVLSFYPRGVVSQSNPKHAG